MTAHLRALPPPSLPPPRPPARPQELSLKRNVGLLTKEHGPFTHLRRPSAAPPKEKKVIKDHLLPSKEGKEKPPAERIIYTDPSGEEFEVTADRTRKLQAPLPPMPRPLPSLPSSRS